MYRPTSIALLSVLAAAVWLLLFNGLALAAEKPIYVEADHMSSTGDSNAVLFTGNVDAKQGDLRIRSDKMTVFYDDPDNPDDKQLASTQRIQKLMCDGNVEITREDWLGTSEHMTYLAGSRQVILTGNAKAWQGQNMVVGEKIIYYMDEGRSEVVGSAAAKTEDGQKTEETGRVRMTIR